MKKYIILPLMLTISFALSGCLETAFGGATATTLSFAKDRPAGDTLTDIKISARIKGELIKGHFKKIYSRVTIEVVQGRVFLAGIVEKEEHMLTAIQVAWNQQGVNDVINEMKVDENSGSFDFVQYTRDTLITSQIKSKMIVDRDIKAINITVITIRDIVYLFGIARSEEELEKAASIAANVNGVKKVVSHVQVKVSAKKVKGNEYSDNLIDNDLVTEQEIDQLFESVDTQNQKPSTDNKQIDFDTDEILINEKNKDW